MSVVSSQPIDGTALDVVIEPDAIETSDISYKGENSEPQNNFPLSEVSNDTNTICYVNQDNSLSFINNPNVFQTVDDCGEIYYACIGSSNDINQQDQVLQLIPQSQISNYIISDKDYSNVNFVNEASLLSENNFYTIPNTNFQVSKYQFGNMDSNVFKSINCTGKQICEICSLEFPSKRTYLKHMSIHENDREFKCSWCKLSYNYEVNLLVHIAIIHSDECVVVNENSEETNYKCAICSCIFSRKKAHQAHCLIHQVDEELPCEFCSSLFKCKVLLEKHLSDHKVGHPCKEDKFSTNYMKCKVCHQIFNNVGNIKKHYGQYHPKSKPQWEEDVEASKSEEIVVVSSDDDKRKSSKIASQTIKLYAQSKVRSTPTKSDSNKSFGKRGRPKKSECKSSKTNSSCTICNKSFKTPILLRRHEVTHTGVKEFECPICKKGFTQKSSVKIHMAVHEAEKGFSCRSCGKRFTYEHNMRTHFKLIHKKRHNSTFPSANFLADMGIEVREYQSENEIICKQDLTLETAPNVSMTDDAEITQYLWNEAQIDQADTENVCYQPNQSNDNAYIPSTANFTKIDWDKSQTITENRGILLSEDVERIDKETGQIQSHEVIKDQVTGFKRFRCHFCFKLYRKSCDLARHVRIHNQSKPFSCYLCRKTFRLKSVLKAHFKSHWKLKEYSCEVCKKSFNLKQTLKVHRQLHEPDKMKHACTLCNRRFNTTTHLKYHMKTNHRAAPNRSDDDHTTIDPVSPVKALIWNDQLDQATPVAETSRKSFNTLYKCNHCGKSYKYKKYLNEHLKDHLSSKKPNVCHFCNKSFLTTRSMQQHMRNQHVNRRKFSCHLCPAFFITKASLIRHGLVHSNHKPFACPICFRRFKAKIYCDRHIAVGNCRKRVKTVSIQNKATNSQTVVYTMPNDNNSHPIHQVQSQIIPNEQIEAFSSFRLEDLDMNSSQPSNILVTNYVNEFSTYPNTEKYMIVSLDNQSNKHHQTSYFTPNMLMDDTPAEAHADPSENMIGIMDGQMGVTPIDMNSIFTVQNYPTNIPGLSAQIVDRNHTAAEIDYTQQGENIYYYQTVNDMPAECQDPIKTSLADKFPILKASLFSDEDEIDTKVNMTPSAVYTHTSNNNVNQFIMSAVNSSFVDRSYQEGKFYHGCANCDQQFKNSELLVNHVKMHHKIRKDFVCNVCNRAFSAKLSLWAHSKTHLDSRSFGCLVCIACNQRFISVPSLSRHVRMQHNDNLNIYRCTHCNNVYKTTRELDSHIKQLIAEYDALIINSNIIENRDPNDVIFTNLHPKTKAPDVDVDMDKVYFSGLDNSQIDEIATLDECTASKLSLKELIKAAKERRGLQKRPRKIQPAKPSIDDALTYPYSCSICHKGFNRASNLQQHLSVHTKMKPYQCSKCPNRFRHRCSLKTHEATKHNAVTKLLRCHLCLKLLRSQIALRNHMAIHVRSYPYRCEHCLRGFQSNEELGKHIRLKHGTTAGTVDSNAKPTQILIDLEQPATKRVVPEIPKKLIKCLSCSFIFDTQSKYSNHYCVRLKSEQSNTCCDETFESKSDFLAHVQTVHEQTQYNCAQCNIMFAQESSYISHQKSIHHL